MKNDSVTSMRKLLKDNVHFDFIYIDGSHNGEDILSDAIEAFKILKVNGLMFFEKLASVSHHNFSPFSYGLESSFLDIL